VQNLEEKESKLHQTRSNFRTGNSDLDGKHLPERCSNSVPPGRTADNYRYAVPAPKCLPERRSGTTTPLAAARPFIFFPETSINAKQLALANYSV